MTIIELKEMQREIIKNDLDLIFAWDVAGDEPLELFEKLIINNKKNESLYKISREFVLSVLMDLSLKIKEITLPIQKVEDSYLERNGFLISSCREEKELLFKSISPSVKKKYKSLAVVIKFVVGGFLDGLFSMLEKLSVDINDVSDLINARGIIIESVKYLGDSHYNGEAVICIQSNKGKFIYKPRDLNCEFIFNNVSCFFGGSKYKVINKDGYGWAEFCEDNASKRYEGTFYNAGKLQAIAYILMLKDLHCGNVIISQNGYSVLDSECLYSAPLDFQNAGFYEYNNILDYLIIPRSSNSDMVNIRLVSTIGRFFDENNISCDEIERVINEFINGFSSVYSEVLKNKEIIIGYINKSFENLKTRVVIRSTGYYKNVLKCLANPRVMMLDSDERSAFLLERISVNGIPPDIINSEVKSLIRYDIPYFYHDHSSGGLTDLFGDVFYFSGCNMKNEIINYFFENTIGENDMNKQIELIRLFMDTEIQNGQSK